MGGNNEFFENFEGNKYLKKLPSMQRVKAQIDNLLLKSLNQNCLLALTNVTTKPEMLYNLLVEKVNVKPVYLLSAEADILCTDKLDNTVNGFICFPLDSDHLQSFTVSA